MRKVIKDCVMLGSLWIMGIAQPKVLLKCIAFVPFTYSPVQTWMNLYFLSLLNARWVWKTFLCVAVDIPMHVKKIHVFLFPFITVLGDFCGKSLILVLSPLSTKLNLDYGIKPAWSTVLGNFWKVCCSQWNLFFYSASHFAESIFLTPVLPCSSVQQMFPWHCTCCFWTTKCF